MIEVNSKVSFKSLSWSNQGVNLRGLLTTEPFGFFAKLVKNDECWFMEYFYASYKNLLVFTSIGSPTKILEGKTLEKLLQHFCNDF